MATNLQGTHYRENRGLDFPGKGPNQPTNRGMVSFFLSVEASCLLAYFRQISFVTDKVGVGLLLIFEVTPWLKNPAPPLDLEICDDV